MQKYFEEGEMVKKLSKFKMLVMKNTIVMVLHKIKIQFAQVNHKGPFMLEWAWQEKYISNGSIYD